MFVIVLVDTVEQGAATLAHQMHEAIQILALPHEYSKIVATVTLSMGLASIVPKAAVSPEQLIAETDRALYAAKAQGRNRAVPASSL